MATMKTFYRGPVAVKMPQKVMFSRDVFEEKSSIICFTPPSVTWERIDVFGFGWGLIARVAEVGKRDTGWELCILSNML